MQHEWVKANAPSTNTLAQTQATWSGSFNNTWAMSLDVNAWTALLLSAYSRRKRFMPRSAFIPMPLILGIVLTGLSSSVAAVPQVTHLTTANNLRATHSPGCIEAEEFTSQDTPADLYPASAACLQKGEDAQAVILYVIGGAYSQYDVLRVRDASAKDAPALIRAQAFGNLSSQLVATFSQEVRGVLSDDIRHRSMCQVLLHVGPPRYQPTYMTQHGMGAFTDPNADRQHNPMDPVTDWLKVMHDYVKCDVHLPSE